MSDSVSVADLPLPQLQQVKQQMDEEITHLTNSYATLKKAQVKFSSGIEALEQVSAKNADKRILVPLTNSLYVAGTLSDADKVIVDVGTGYYMEKSVGDAQSMFKRKIDFIKGNLDKLSSTINQRNQQRSSLHEVMQIKMATLRAETAKAGAASVASASS